MRPHFTYGERKLHPDRYYYRDYILRVEDKVYKGRIDEMIYHYPWPRAVYEKDVFEARHLGITK